MRSSRRRGRLAPAASPPCWRKWRRRHTRATSPGRVTRWSACGVRRRPRSTTYELQPKVITMASAIPVLVVDDDPVSNAQLSALAQGAGYDVRTVPNGRAAWDLLQRMRIPIAISDWAIPEMARPELCRRIRARPREPYVYFILVTSRGGN